MQFSIITATYNSEKYLSETLDSVLNLDFNDFEYIVIDGKSNDGTLNILTEYKDKFKSKNIPFQFISEKDSGIYDAWNKGIKLAKGNWISFLGSDDVYLPDSLEKYDKWIQKENPNYVSSKIELINETGNALSIYGEAFNKKKILFEMRHAHVGSFIKTDLLKNIGFSTDYSIVGDYHFFLQQRNVIKAAFIPAVTAKMRVGGVSSSDVKKVFLQNRDLKNDLKILNPFTNELILYYQILKHRLLNIIRKN